MKTSNQKISTDDPAALLPKIVEAGFAGNKQRLELLTLNAIRSLKEDRPQVASKLSALLGDYANPAAALRFAPSEPLPADTEAGFTLLRLESSHEAMEPILDPVVESAAKRFLQERAQGEELLREGISPPRTLLLKGKPGTGKTMLATWLAKELHLPLAVLDLATSISSFLGKTGSNLRRSLDYARAVPCVLLLDEFDAIGKRRDDTTEHGELKRIVNVLLKELEVWPLHSVLVAATNHPELLDPAIHRRFDVVLEMPLPSEKPRQAILERACGRFASTLPDGFLTAVARVKSQASGSDLDTLARASVRRHIIEKDSLAKSFVAALESEVPGGIPTDELAFFCQTLNANAGLTVREIGDLTGRGSSTIQYYLKKKKRKDPDDA